MPITINRRKVLSTLAALGITTAVAAASLLAPEAPYQQPVQTISFCDLGGVIVASRADGYTAKIEVQGRTGFQTVENSSHPSSTTLRALAFEGRGFSPELGEISFSLASKEETSTITANQEEDAFPATSRLTFDGQFNLETEDGGTYNGTLTVSNSNIKEWPHRNTEYTQEGEAIFANVDDPSRTIIVSGVQVYVNALGS